MSSSQSCPRCSQPVAVHTPNGLCPSCGMVLQNLIDTPKAEQTPRFSDEAFAVGAADPNLTAVHLASTIHQEAAFKQNVCAVPTIPNYTDFEFLGQGGMGTVFRAIQRPTDRPVAVKVLPNFAPKSPFRDRFISEVRALAKLRHDCVVPIYEVGECSFGPYFTMELVTGGTVIDRLKQGPLPVQDAARIIAAAAEGVHAAHQQGIIHRDIKPSNILLTADGRVKVSDFGLAKHVDGTDITEYGVIVGTPSYMSPEQAEGDPAKVTKASDIYCLGSTLYHLTTGQPAHRGGTPQATLKLKSNDPTPRPQQQNPELCPVLDAIIQKCMARDPAGRYETAAALADDLGRWDRGEPTAAKPLTRGQKVRRVLRRHRVALTAAVLLPFLLTGVAIAKRNADRDADPKWQFEQALDRGEPFVLVGPKDLRVPPVWDFNDSKITQHLLAEGAVGFETQHMAMLRLVENPRADNYRIEAELRHCSRSNVNSSFVGIYFGPDDGVADDGTPFSRYAFFQFSDFAEGQEKVSPAAAVRHRLRIEDHWIVRDNVRYDPFTIYLSGEDHTALRFQPADDSINKNRWRKLVLDVTPAGVGVQWYLDAAGPPLATTVPASTLNRAMSTPANKRFSRGGAELIPKPWTPRRPIGIVAASAGVAVRNVQIQTRPTD